MSSLERWIVGECALAVGPRRTPGIRLRMLETSSATPLGASLAEQMNADLSACADDPRWQLDVPSEYFDVVLLANLGRVRDRPTEGHGFERNDGWVGSGVTNLLKESARSLAPGGLLLALVENAVSLRSALAILNGQHPVVDQGSLRTFSAEQLRVMVGGFGLAPISVTSSPLDPLTVLDEERRVLFDRLGAVDVERGDMLLGIFEKSRDAGSPE